jgi:hypothetical protein
MSIKTPVPVPRKKAPRKTEPKRRVRRHRKNGK